MAVPPLSASSLVAVASASTGGATPAPRMAAVCCVLVGRRQRQMVRVSRSRSAGLAPTARKVLGILPMRCVSHAIRQRVGSEEPESRIPGWNFLLGQQVAGNPNSWQSPVAPHDSFALVAHFIHLGSSWATHPLRRAFPLVTFTSSYKQCCSGMKSFNT